MKNYIIPITLLIAFASAGKLQAQTNPDGPQFSLFYSYALPAGYMKNNIVSEGSPRGLGFELSWRLNNHWRLGPSFGFQDFFSKDERRVFKPDPATDISAVVSNSIQIYPVLIKAIYLPMADKNSRVQPFISAGAGGALVTNRQLWGMFDVINSQNFALAFSGGAGLQFAVGSAQKANIFVGAHYQYIPYNRFEIPTLNSINAQAGVRLRLNRNSNSDYYQQTPNPRYYQNR